MISVKKAPHPLLKEREQDLLVSKVQEKMAEHDIDALIVFRPENIYYTSGYYPKVADIPGNVGNELTVVPREGDVTLIVSTLEYEGAMCATSDSVKVEAYPSWVFIDDGTEKARSSKQDGEIDMFNGIRRAIDTVKSCKNVKTIGVELPFLTVPIWKKLTELWDSANIKDSSIVFRDARRIKTPWEIKMLRIAAQHCERTMYRVAQDIKPGMLCCEIDNLMGKYGFMEDKYFTADRSLFATEAAGPYFGLSGIQRGYEVKEGDIIRFDGGFRHLGYISDLARCFCVGDNPEPKAIEIYDALLEGYRAGVEMIKPGVRMKDIYDTVIRKVTSSKVIPAYPRGHVGHSIGMNNLLEEWPQISANMEEVLLPGMVISFETPIWTTGMSEHFGAFSIEDTFAITENGAERFTFGNETLIWK